MQSKFHDDILKLITVKGPLGVNALAKELDIPVSSLQKDLNRQDYFRINESRKWDVPENVGANAKGATLALTVGVIKNSILLLQAQLEETQLSIDNALAPIGTLERGIKSIQSPPVANKPITNDPNIEKLVNFIDVFQKTIKKYIPNIPDEYKELVLNLDIAKLSVYEGINYINSARNEDLTNVLLGNSDELTEDTLSMLKKYQRET